MSSTELAQSESWVQQTLGLREGPELRAKDGGGPRRPTKNITLQNSGSNESVQSGLNYVKERLERIESILISLVERQTVREWYSVEQLAQIVAKSEFTVREWARLGRIRAKKMKSGRGAYAGWVISHDELMRYHREGLLPLSIARPE